MTPDLLARFDALPTGTFAATAHGRRYVVSRTAVAGGRGWKLVAEARDGSDYISLNLYRLCGGPRLRPCEMPEAKVLAFLADLAPEG